MVRTLGSLTAYYLRRCVRADILERSVMIVDFGPCTRDCVKFAVINFVMAR